MQHFLLFCGSSSLSHIEWWRFIRALTFDSVDKIYWCGQSDETSLAMILHEAIFQQAWENRQHFVMPPMGKNNLRKLTPFCDATIGFPVKWHRRNECRNSILMTRHQPDLALKALPRSGSSVWNVWAFFLDVILSSVFSGYFSAKINIVIKWMRGHGAGMGEAFFNLCGTESSSLTKPLGQKSAPSMPPSCYRVLVLLAFQYNIKAKLKQTITIIIFWVIFHTCN